MVGGNLASADGPVAWTVTLIGDVAHGAHWTRTGARPGDVLAASGPLGRAAAALALADAAPEVRSAAGAAAHALAGRWSAPPSRVALAAELARAGGVHAAMDVSDGLAGDLAHLCDAGGVGARLRSSAFTADDVLVAAARALGAVHPAAFALAPGDDYELLLAIAPEAWGACRDASVRLGAPLVELGAITAERVRVLVREDGGEEEVRGAGWNHFA
ncbi:MAG: AIR synthase-related protein [Candidatus Eisenbacteria bacterium]